MKPKTLIIALVACAGLCGFGFVYFLVRSHNSPIPFNYGTCEENGKCYAFPRGVPLAEARAGRHEVPREAVAALKRDSIVYAATFVPGLLIFGAVIVVYALQRWNREQRKKREEERE